MRLLLNTVYALLAERAVAVDLAELVLSPHVADKERPNMARNRDELDVMLGQPIGKQAEAESALLRSLGGAA